MSVFNEEQYLPETIPALLAQSMPDFHAVILDNGSTDGSWAYLCSLTDPRVSLFRSPTNLAPAIAANEGWARCMALFPECRWFLGAGADDLMDPGYLEAILDATAARPEVNLIFSPWRWIDHPEKGTFHFARFNPRAVHTELQISSWRAFTRDLWATVGEESTTCGPGSDWHWAVRAALSGALRPHQLDRPYIALRVRNGARRSASEEGHWPTICAHLCGLLGLTPPVWAKPYANRRTG